MTTHLRGIGRLRLRHLLEHLHVGGLLAHQLLPHLLLGADQLVLRRFVVRLDRDDGTEVSDGALVVIEGEARLGGEEGSERGEEGREGRQDGTLVVSEGEARLGGQEGSERGKEGRGRGERGWHPRSH